MEHELNFKVKKSRTVTKPDGSISVFIKCPIDQCLDGFTVTYKGYTSTYKKRRRQNIRSIDGGNSATPRWHYASLRQNLLNSHCENENNEENIDDSENYDSESSEREPISDNQIIETNHDGEASIEGNVELHSVSKIQKSNHQISRKKVQGNIFYKTIAQTSRENFVNSLQLV